ncbi:30S ribosomal protein S5 [Candidatus Dojkabacteria bacterium]|nr:30S ribosomal protein S5 [Candidatus Dojkabacteria bacterium]
MTESKKDENKKEKKKNESGDSKKTDSKKQTQNNVKSDKSKQKKVQVKRKKSSRSYKRKKKKRRRRNQEEFEKRIISIRRVSRVNKGGRRLRLSVCIVIGDKKGRIGIGLAKGEDVRSAEEKAYKYAKKHMKKIPLKNNTIPHEFYHKKGAARVFMKPASPGTGIVAGSSLRAVMEVLGVKDVLSKIIGSNNAINNAYAAIEGLSQMKHTVNTKKDSNNKVKSKTDKK